MRALLTLAQLLVLAAFLGAAALPSIIMGA